MGIPQILEHITFNDMKTLKYILFGVLLCANLTSCTPDPLEEYSTENTEVVATKGEKGGLEDDDS